MEKNKIAVTVIRSVTAIVCCIAVAVTSVSISGKICDSNSELARLAASHSEGDSTGAQSNAQSDVYSSTESNEDNALTDDVVIEAPDSGEESAVEDVTDEAGSVKEISVTSGLNSTDKDEVLKYYQLVMEKNEKDGLGHSQTLTLKKLDGGSGGVGKFISWFEPVAKEALADNSTSYEGLPGVHDQIKASDFASAKAVNDGRYTTVTINLVEQTDGAYGKTSEGTVGRTIGVLDGIAVAVAAINGLKVDFDTGEVYLHYKNPKVVIKVDNKTGALVKGACSWGYQVHVDIKKLDVSMMGISVTLNGAVGIIDMVSSY